jgi:hypothetical protein
MEKNYQKRIEKISQAIYLVSNHLKDNEPLKWELRKESIGFLSCIRSIDEGADSEEVPPDLVVDALSTYAKDLTSLITLAVVGGLISKNNAAIITLEIEALMVSFKEVTDGNAPRSGFILSQEFFATDPELRDNLAPGMYKGQTNLLSDKNPGLFNEKIQFPKKMKDQKGGSPESNPENKDKKEDGVKDKKNSRQMRILTLLRAQAHLSIKDFASVIPDCSEKTIQRELLELVEKGIIKKEGERRWSTYSLI